MNIKTKIASLSEDRKALLLLTLWSAAVLLLVSSDSPLHGEWDRLDSSWFFTSGKAMMLGMKPYVAFADSKGPLLWLIYGVGYLLTPRSYVGVWVLSCLCYAGILYFNYKTARLFLGDFLRSLAAAMVMPFIYFQYWFHDDVRAEDFCTLPVAVSLLVVMRLLTAGRSGRRAAHCDGLVLGASFMALVLIKWNVAAMQATLVAVALWYYWREERQGLQAFGATAAGAAAVALPFVAWLLARGAFGAFVQEYFVNTLLTVTPEGDVADSYLGELATTLGTAHKLALLLGLLAGGWLVSRQRVRYRLVPVAVPVLFFLACSRHALFHYHSICYVFLLFLVVHLFSQARVLKVRSLAVVGCCVLLWGYGENVREGSHLAQVWLWGKRSHEAHYRYFADHIEGHHPRIMYLYGCDYGYGLASEAVPAGRYWSYQKGTTPKMEQEHLRPLLEGLADYVIVNDQNLCESKGYSTLRLHRLGYRRLCMKRYYSLQGVRRVGVIYERRDRRI
jgi:hypothetical protein